MIVESACEIAKSDDFGEDTWSEGFERLVEALRSEARLNRPGVGAASKDREQQLANRLGIVAYLDEHPEVAEADVAPPVVIVGHGRTGTTILHDLLAQDPAARAPLTWEVERPCPPPERESHDRDPRIEATEAPITIIEEGMPELRTMHPMGARLARECVCITAADFRSTLFGSQYSVPSYVRWLLEEADMAPAGARRGWEIEVTIRFHWWLRFLRRPGSPGWLPCEVGNE